MSESGIIKVYHERIQSVVTLVQGLSTQISELLQTVEKQNKTISDLDARLKKLEKQSNQTKNGGQVGHKGSTLKRIEDPNHVVTHHPQTCQGCGCPLEDVEPEKMMKHQVFDLSPLNIQITEYRVLTKVCPNCHYKNEGKFPKNVTQPTQYGPHLISVLSYLSHYRLIAFNYLKQLAQDIFGATINQGTMVNMTKRFYELLETTEIAIKECRLSSNYLHLDETGCYVNAKRQWLHVTSNKRYIHYFVHEKHGFQAIKANGILPSFKGTVIHDHWTLYFKYDD